MDGIIDTITGLPEWGYVVAAAAVAAIVAVVIVAAVRRAAFVRRFLALKGAAGEDIAAFRRKYDAKSLLRRSALIERLLTRAGDGTLVRRLGLDRLWIDRLRDRGSQRDFHRVMTYVRGEGLWPCFKMALGNERRAERLREWLAGHESWYALREIARAAQGDTFDGDSARLLLRDYMDQVREMTGDPDWSVRHFAVSIMLHDGSRHSERGLWESVHDSSHPIRALLASRFQPEERERLYETLRHFVLRDPVFAVRRAARARIATDFADRYKVRLDELEPYEAAHALELLSGGSSEDQNVALKALEGEDLELRLPAARYLRREGVLVRMLEQVDIGDEDARARTRSLLERAAEVHVTEFLNTARDSENPGSLLVALEILHSCGPPELIAALARRVFGRFHGGEHGPRLYEAALYALAARGDERAFAVLKEELLRRRHDTETAARILESAPAYSAPWMTTSYLELLTDPDFGAREALTDAVVRSGSREIVPSLIDIGRDTEGNYELQCRIHALKVLGAMSLEYCLAFVLEHLHLFPTHEAREFARHLAAQHSELFDGTVERLLESTDAAVRAGVMAVLPATGRKQFKKAVKEALDDADPDVRIAAVWALSDFGDTTSLKDAAGRLRDPVEAVRSETAVALGATGSSDLLKQLRELIDDENEVDAVKTAAVLGLGASPSEQSVDILVGEIERQPELSSWIVDSLSRKTDSKLLRRLVERFKDADPRLRQQLSDAFTRMGKEGEATMIELLEEEIASLAPTVAEVLENTGSVESMIRRLTHRDASVRRDAARVLSLIGTHQAFRGIVQAARDPDQDVRVQVTRALERLGSEDGKEILDKLREDPDRRVRKYTQWALDRMRAKAS